MPIIIKIGPNVLEIFWALLTLLGVVLITSGFLYALSSLTNFDKIILANTAALSHVSGGIIIFIVGLVATGAGYLGIRGRIIITTSEDTKQNPA